MAEPKNGIPGRYVVLTMVGAAIIMGLFALWYRDLSPVRRPTTQPATTRSGDL